MDLLPILAYFSSSGSSPDRKKTSSTFNACVVLLGLLAVLVLYPMSFGPWWWLYQYLGDPEWMGTASCIYAPLFWAFDCAPETVRDLYLPYLYWWDVPLNLEH